MLDAVLSAKTSPTVRIGETVVCHGHVEPEADAGRYVVGHDHPAITIEGQKRPCYLVGEGVYEGSDLLVLPAFSRLVAGARIDDMRTDDFLSPLVTDVGALRPIVRDTESKESLEFPPLGEFRHRL
jgi:metallophosphoesterase superfamily enzyme